MASPTSAQQPAQQRSAEDSREQFDRRMRNKMSQLKAAGRKFFYKRVCKTMAPEVVQGPETYCLEFPTNFLKQHIKYFSVNVTFVMTDSERKWPIKLKVRANGLSIGRVFANGAGGWKIFLRDNYIKVGDVLFFSLIGFSQFQVLIERAPVEAHPDEDSEVHPKDDGDDNGDKVVINRASVEVHPQVNGNDNGENNEHEVNMDIDDGDEDKDHDKSSAKCFRNTWPCWNAHQAPVPCTVCKQSPPRFSVAIPRSSHPRHLSLDVPGYFWDLNGNMLKCTDLQMRGLNKAIFTVSAKHTYDLDEEKLYVSLESGWEAFLVANELRVGDILEFFLVGNSCFTVDLLKRIEKH